MSFVQQMLEPLFGSPTPYCLPTQSCFPSLAALGALNQSLSGRLHRPEPHGCVAGSSANSCMDPEWRVRQPAAVQFNNFETGWGESNTSAPVDTEAARGRLPSYVVEATNAEDVREAVAFAAEHRLRLRVKNTGHDYLGRSSEAGSFTIWTSALNATRYEPRFVPEGAPQHYDEPQPALIIGAGVRIAQMYEAAETAGVLVAGGVSRTVGAGGGYVLGGGHGPLAPLLGLAIDQVLEFTVVTSDATIVKASPYLNPTLFTALRGGGSAFGVVVEVVYRAHKPPSGFIGIFGTFDTQPGLDVEVKKEEWKGLIKEWVDLQPKLSDAGPFAGYCYIRRPQVVPFAYILPSNDLALAKSAWEPFLAYADSHPNVKVNITFEESPSWFPLYQGAFTEALHSLDTVGINLLLGGRLVPNDVVRENGDDLAEFLAALKSPAITHLVSGGAVNADSYFPSTVNPRWRSTLLHIDLPVAWPAGTPPQAIAGMEKYLTSTVLALGKVATSTGVPESAYASESDWNEEHWQDVWYGKENYQTLLAAKREWDPKGVFSGRKVPGSEYVGY